MSEVSPTIRARAEAGVLWLEACVAGPGLDELTWRLTVDTAGRGGRSRVVQTGDVGVARSGPLASVRVDAAGHAVLEIFEHGLIAGSTTLTFPAPSASPPER